MSNLNDDRDAFIATLGLTYEATFVPFSKSRNAGEKYKSLNWVVTLVKGGHSLRTDYMQGIAHVPGYNKFMQGGRTIEVVEREARAAERGEYFGHTLTSFVKGNKIPAPLLRDVLWSLVNDSNVLDYGTFEEWASEFGFDADSHKDEKIYKACLENALRLRVMVDDAALARLRELFQDY